MGTPKTVQRQLDAAQALQQAAAGTPAPSNLIEDVAQIAAQPSDTPATPASEPAPPAPPPQPAPPARAPRAPQSEETWEARFRSLQGLFNQKMPQLQQQLQERDAEMERMRAQLNELTAAAKPTEPQKPSVDPRDAERFGDDMMDMVQRYVSNALQVMDTKFTSFGAALDQRIGKLEQTVNGVREDTAVSREEQFYAVLTNLVPNWREINQSENFLEWLGEMDPVYGVPRQAALDAAYKRLNAQHAAGIFSAYKASQPADLSPTASVAPTTVHSSAQLPPQTVAKPMISHRAVQKFYDDMARGKYANDPGEAARLEAEINLAAQENRIV